jgi:hypothetical protein
MRSLLNNVSQVAPVTWNHGSHFFWEVDRQSVVCMLLASTVPAIKTHATLGGHAIRQFTDLSIATVDHHFLKAFKGTIAKRMYFERPNR